MTENLNEGLTQVQAIHWTNYVAVVTGLIGAICGVAGAVVAIVSYRKTSELKTLDLRLELRKAASDLRSSVSRTSELVTSADSSRSAVASATGRYHSGSMQQWAEDVQTDQAEISEIESLAPTSDETFEELPPVALETRLVEIHTLQSRCDLIEEKYESSMRVDDEARRQLREDVRASTNRRT